MEITILAAILGAAMAFPMGVLRLSKRRLVRTLAGAYVEFFRGTSALVQLFWLFFVLPLAGIKLDPMTAGVLALGLNIGAYGAEVVRGAVQSVPHGQVEAAIALNMTEMQRMRRVVIPQALVAMLPPLGNLAIELLKLTSLVSLITLHDITFNAQTLRESVGHTTEIFAAVLLMYFVLASAISVGMRALERRVGRWREAPLDRSRAALRQLADTMGGVPA